MEKEKQILNTFFEFIKNAPLLQVFGISALFGIASWIQKVRRDPLKRNFFDFTTEIFIAITGGFLSAKICDSFNIVSDWRTVAICIAAYSGVKFMDFVNFLVLSKIGDKFGIDADKVNTEINRLNEREEEEKKRLINLNSELVKAQNTKEKEENGNK